LREDVDDWDIVFHAVATMTVVGKTIHDLGRKVGEMVDVLHSAGRIDRPAINRIAIAADIRYRTLLTSIRTGRVSPEVESRLCGLGKFAPGDESWCDLSQPEPERRRTSGPYSGADTVAAFRQMLRSAWQQGGTAYRAVTREVTPINPDLACHEINDCQQSTVPPLEINLFLEASFGVIWNEDVRYGLGTVRVRLNLGEDEAAEFRILLGRDEIARLGDAELRSRGTSTLPCWELSRNGEAGGFLEGEYRTTQGPLVSVRGYADIGTEPGCSAACTPT
jgi:hypothetical protein